MGYCTLLLLGQLMLASASHASTFELSCANVQSIRVYSISRDWSIDVRMNDAGATALRDVTRRNLHHEMTVLAGGEELVREVVHAALEHGVLLFWEPTREEALRKVARICPERLVPQAESARPYPP